MNEKCDGMAQCQKDKAILDARRNAMGFNGPPATLFVQPHKAVADSDDHSESVWRAVKSALQEYGRQYPKTVAGKIINRLWGD